MVTAKGDATFLSRRNRNLPPPLNAHHSSLILRISDTGIGIPEDDLARIFEPEFRCAAAKDKPGNGLGLAFAYSVAKLYGGEIACESTLNEGTTFTVQLPLTTKESNS